MISEEAFIRELRTIRFVYTSTGIDFASKTTEKLKKFQCCPHSGDSTFVMMEVGERKEYTFFRKKI